MSLTVLPLDRFSVAPMMDWTDRHCRYFHRQLTQQALLYTEMVTTGALLHGQLDRLLDFDASEQPLVLQIGGSEPHELAACARLGQQWGYQAINLNCGCPSERVQRGAFGACLMLEPELVRDCVKAMSDAVEIPITVKHRIGVDKLENYAFVRDFVGTVAQGGARTFIVHARSAWLQGLSPKENREVPPLRYEFVYQLKRDFPSLQIVVNGGIVNFEQIAIHLRELEGVMLGRECYQNPWLLSEVDAQVFGRMSGHEVHVRRDRWQVVDAMVEYAETMKLQAVPLRAITRHMLGLFNGMAGARAWRRMLSDPSELARNDPQLLKRAADLVPVLPAASAA